MFFIEFKILYCRMTFRFLGIKFLFKSKIYQTRFSIIYVIINNEINLSQCCGVE